MPPRSSAHLFIVAAVEHGRPPFTQGAAAIPRLDTRARYTARTALLDLNTLNSIFAGTYQFAASKVEKVSAISRFFDVILSLTDAKKADLNTVRARCDVMPLTTNAVAV